LTSVSSGCKSECNVIGALRFQGQTSWQISQPKTWRPIFSRIGTGISPRFSLVKYAMQREAQSCRGATIASVGQASMQRVQVPHRSGATSIFSFETNAENSSEVTITPRKIHEP